MRSNRNLGATDSQFHELMKECQDLLGTGNPKEEEEVKNISAYLDSVKTSNGTLSRVNLPPSSTTTKKMGPSTRRTLPELGKITPLVAADLTSTPPSHAKQQGQQQQQHPSSISSPDDKFTALSSSPSNTTSPRRLFQPMHNLRQIASRSSTGTGGGLTSSPSVARTGVSSAGLADLGFSPPMPAAGVVTNVHSSASISTPRAEVLHNSSELKSDAEEETPSVSGRPNSATSFREYIQSASRDSSIARGGRSTTTAGGVYDEEKITLDNEQLARDVARLKREKERKERQERRSRQQSDTPRGEVKDAGSSDNRVAAVSQEESNPRQLAEKKKQAEEEAEKKKMQDELEERQRAAAKAEAEAQAKREREEEEQRKEREHQLEKEAIRVAAQHRREERRLLEEAEAKAKAEAEQVRLKIWEMSRDVAWDESVLRGDIVAEEEPERRRIVKLYAEAPTKLLQLNAMEREDRGFLQGDYLPEWYEIILLECSVAEAILRKQYRIQAYEQGMKILEACKMQHPRQEAVLQESRQRAEIVALWEFGLEEELYGDYCKSNNFLVEREMWRCNVGEAEGRMALEKEELELLAICYDGCSSSRHRVKKHVEAALAAKQQWKAFVQEAVQELVDEELAGRLLLQKKASSDWDLEIEVPSRASKREAQEKETSRHQQEVERAIREAQLFQAQNSSEVSYQQQITSVHQKINQRNTGTLKKKTVQSSVPLVDPATQQRRTPKVGARVPLKGITSSKK